jgi:hypothetical protein
MIEVKEAIDKFKSDIKQKNDAPYSTVYLVGCRIEMLVDDLTILSWKIPEIKGAIKRYGIYKKDKSTSEMSNAFRLIQDVKKAIA